MSREFGVRDHHALLTIIVPFFNSEATIIATLNSLHESLSNCCSDKRSIQLLLVNNNSEDSSSDLVGDWIINHPYIDVEVVFEPSRGVSHARNLGVAKAAGIYVGFVDSDDVVATDYFACVLDALQSFPDVVVMPLRSGGRLSAVNSITSGYLSESKSVFYVLTQLEGWWNCQFICRTAEIASIGFRGLCFEDLGIFPIILDKASTVRIIERPVYTYLEMPGSITRSSAIKYVEEVSAQQARLFVYLNKKGLVYGRVRADVFQLQSIHRSLDGILPVRSAGDLTSVVHFLKHYGLLSGGRFVLHRLLLALKLKVRRCVERT